MAANPTGDGYLCEQVKSDLKVIRLIAPKELIKEVGRLVGPRRPSEFFTAAAGEKLKCEKLLQATRRAMSLSAELDVPGWETSEAVSTWVHDLRVGSDRRRNV